MSLSNNIGQAIFDQLDKEAGASSLIDETIDPIYYKGALELVRRAHQEAAARRKREIFRQRLPAFAAAAVLAIAAIGWLVLGPLRSTVPKGIEAIRTKQLASWNPVQTAIHIVQAPKARKSLPKVSRASAGVGRRSLVRQTPARNPLGDRALAFRSATGEIKPLAPGSTAGVRLFGEAEQGLRIYREAEAAMSQQLFNLAVDRYAEALRIVETNFGKNHMNIVPVANGLGQALFSIGRTEEALPIAERALTLAKEHYSAGHDARAMASFNLARILSASGRMAEAATLYQDSIETFQRNGSKPPHQVARIAIDVSRAYEFSGQSEKSRAYLKLAKTLLEQSATIDVLAKEAIEQGMSSTTVPKDPFLGLYGGPHLLMAHRR